MSDEGECAVHGKVKAEKKALLNVVLDDGTDNMRALVSGDNLNRIGLSNDEIFSLEKFNEKKNSILGEEKVFSGFLKNNQLYNTTEFNISFIEDIKTDELIKELEEVVAAKQ